MFRQATWIVVAIVLVAGVNCRPADRKAGDEVQPAPSKEAEEKKPEQVKESDLGDRAVPPADSGTGPRAQNEAGEKKAQEEPSHRFGGRGGSGSRKAMLATGGGTKHTERAVTAALVWLAKHQSPDGSWSLHDYAQQCTDKTCAGQSDLSSDAGATALGLLPFLAAGQTHKMKGPYTGHIRKGIDWLIQHQQPDGNLAKGSTQMMYGHGLATIALAETYGLTGDQRAGEAAQAAVNFIVNAQNPQDGGWCYNPKEPGDTSVFAWQLMALKSADVAGLKVDRSVLVGARKWLDAVAVHDGTEYSYQPGSGSTPSMTAIGLLGRQYLGARRDNPMLVGGDKYLMNHLPDENLPDVYYWYFADKVLYNMSGYEWDTWSRKKREVLVRTQVSDVNSCANGSWNPAKDAWGKQGGRLVITSLSVLPLQVYYHWIPIMRPFKADEEAVPERETKPEENRTIKPAKKTPRKFKVREKGDVEDSLPTDSGMDAEKEKKAREKEDADHRILESKPGDAVPADPVGPPKAHSDSAPPAVPQKKPANDPDDDPFG